MLRIESLLSARLFLRPQVVGQRIYFLSNLSGHISLYAMNFGGSVPEPLLPPHIALQNPHLMEGRSFYVFPRLDKILVMVDKDGDENYQPMLIPTAGGFPEVAFNNFFAGDKVFLGQCDPERNIIYLTAASLSEEKYVAFQGNLETGDLQKLVESPWGLIPGGMNQDHTKIAWLEGYTLGDGILSLWEHGVEPKVLYGVPIQERQPGQEVQLSQIFAPHFVCQDRGLLFDTALFSDYPGLGYLEVDQPQQARPVEITGVVHTGVGELENLTHLNEDRYLLQYNIDGCSWLYEGIFDETALRMDLKQVLCGRDLLANGVLEAVSYDREGDRFALAYSTAISPTQIYTIEGPDRQRITRHTNERILGIPTEWLSPGEDASFESYDGTRVSARLYFPAGVLGYAGPRPLVYYIHGGPQGQERPDFAWFSMPLIQFLTLNGFAVFVPNVRGSTGYGLSYTKQVDRDWGGRDRLDHVHAMTELLPKDPRLDASRAGVVGRSYGGYMTLTLAGRHPELWKAAVDMFGPYDLLTFSKRIPESWKPYFRIALGDPEADREFLVERSPRTYIEQAASPLLVIQGKNDPRVVERESRDLIAHLRGLGKRVDYLVFENEGHDVLKFENRVRCYHGITDFFKEHLRS